MPPPASARPRTWPPSGCASPRGLTSSTSRSAGRGAWLKWWRGPSVFFLFPSRPPVLGWRAAAGDGGRQGGGAGGEYVNAGARLAERADGGGGRLSRGGVRILGRIVGAAEDAALDRQQAARRDPKGSGHAGDSGKTGEARRPAAADERRAIRTVRPRRCRKDGEARQGRQHPADELICDRPLEIQRASFG